MEIQATSKDRITMTIDLKELAWMTEAFEALTLNYPDSPDQRTMMMARMAGELMATEGFLRERFAAGKEAAR